MWNYSLTQRGGAKKDGGIKWHLYGMPFKCQKSRKNQYILHMQKSDSEIDVILLWQYDRLSVPYSLSAKAGAWRKEMRLKRWRRK